LDLGLGRSGGRAYLRDRVAAPERQPATVGAPARQGRVEANGLVIPARPSLRHLMGSPRVALSAELLQQANAESPDYPDLVGDVVGLLRGTYRSEADLDPRPVPGHGADVQVWVLGSSAGPSASVAGRLGLRFAANYHVSPSTVLQATEAYRAAFVPSAELERPFGGVSAAGVGGPADASARRAAAGFGRWVLSIRSGEGAIPFPSPAEAAAHDWTDEERALVADRVETQFVGSPATVAAHLARLQEAAGADEIVVTTITHDHVDRVRSYQLLAKERFGS
jgi:luciferase family oxidoreductase group 1